MQVEWLGPHDECLGHDLLNVATVVRPRVGALAFYIIPEGQRGYCGHL